jgi:hypothetical protein
LIYAIAERRSDWFFAIDGRAVTVGAALFWAALFWEGDIYGENAVLSLTRKPVAWLEIGPVGGSNLGIIRFSIVGCVVWMERNTRMRDSIFYFGSYSSIHAGGASLPRTVYTVYNP